VARQFAQVDTRHVQFAFIYTFLSPLLALKKFRNTASNTCTNTHIDLLSPQFTDARDRWQKNGSS